MHTLWLYGCLRCRCLFRFCVVGPEWDVGVVFLVGAGGAGSGCCSCSCGGDVVVFGASHYARRCFVCVCVCVKEKCV